MLLDGDGGPADADVSEAGQPASDPTLDDHGSKAQPLGSQPLQESHLTGPEEHFGLSKAVLVRVRDEFWQSLSAQGLGLILVLGALEQDAVSDEELLVRPSREKETDCLTV